MKPIAVTLGDPAGIGPEVVLKAVASLEIPVRLFGSRRFAEASGPVPPKSDFVDVPAEGELRFGHVDPLHGRVALESIEAAIEAVARGECSALVTGPIHKQAIAAAGSPYPGHTEMLAARAGLTHYGREYAMYFDSPRLRTVLLSVHVPLRQALGSITADGISELAVLTSREHRRIHGLFPRIAVAGLNPHAGEGGRFGDEEAIIAAGVDAARRQGVDASGPHAPDTVFRAACTGSYDVVLAMYHDQGLIALKTLDFERSVNVTIGLPYLRCSVDHGTAFDIAGKGVADARPMRNAIEWAARHAVRWTR